MSSLKPISLSIEEDHENVSEQKKVALSCIMGAWEDAIHQGIGLEMMANAALFKAFSDLVTIYGEESVADMTVGLSSRVLQGEFSLRRTLQ